MYKCMYECNSYSKINKKRSFSYQKQKQFKKKKKICSKFSFIKWETFKGKIFEKILFPLGAKRENTLKKGPPKQRLPLGPLFFVPDTRGLTLMKIKYSPIVQF